MTKVYNRVLLCITTIGLGLTFNQTGVYDTCDMWELFLRGKWHCWEPEYDWPTWPPESDYDFENIGEC